MDLLVKLYTLKPSSASHVRPQTTPEHLAIRKPYGFEHESLRQWVNIEFGNAWLSELNVALAHTPISCLIALLNGKLAGFACYNATALGMFGPLGVGHRHRAQGLGSALLQHALLEMHALGYAYAVIGAASSIDFYKRAVDAIEIEDSTPGIYAGLGLANG